MKLLTLLVLALVGLEGVAAGQINPNPILPNGEIVVEARVVFEDGTPARGALVEFQCEFGPGPAVTETASAEGYTSVILKRCAKAEDRIFAVARLYQIGSRGMEVIHASLLELSQPKQGDVLKFSRASAITIDRKNTARIYGRIERRLAVENLEEFPIEVIVRFNDTPFWIHGQTAWILDGGEFSFQVQPGTYRVQFNLNGLNGDSGEITLKAGESKEITNWPSVIFGIP